MLLLDEQRVIEIHDDILSKYRGLPGLAANQSLSSALDRIQNGLLYGTLTDIFEVAAKYGEALAGGHVFNDANKRTALVAMKVFLDLNGYDLLATNDEAENYVVEIAKKNVSHDQLTAWLKNKCQKKMPEAAIEE